MKRVLMIAPSSYPVNVAEAIVNIKLLQVLSESEQFCIDLVSRRRKWEKYPSDSLESYGIRLNSLHIVEVDNVVNLSTIYQNLMTFLKFGIVHKGYHWAFPAWKTVKPLLKRGEYDYILTKDAPSMVLGYQIRKCYQTKWVATWNDPCPWKLYPKPYGQGLEATLSFMEKRIIKKMKAADIHIFPNRRLCRYMNHFLNIDSSRCFIIPHVITRPSQTVRHFYSDKLRLIHSGNLSKPRSPESFLQAFRMFLDESPSAKVLFTIMGHCDPTVNSLISRLRLEDYVSFVSPIEYKQSLQVLSSYDIAVIIEADCEEGIFLPTKVSDFLQMSIPIFAVSPQEGVLNDLYNEKQISYFACVRNVDSIYKQLKQMYEDFENDTIPCITTLMEDMTAGSIVRKYLSF